MWTVVPRNKNPLPLETTSGHHDVVSMQRRLKPIVQTIVLRSIVWPNTKRHWPSKRLGVAMVPVQNLMTRSRLLANGSICVQV